MIADAHGHAWPHWPYPGTGESGAGALLRDLDRAGVERALLVGARIGANVGADDDNDYLIDWAARHPDRLDVAVEVDGRWSAEHETPGAVDRLARWIGRPGVAAVALYPPADRDDWLRGPGSELIMAAAEAGLVVSLAGTPAHYAAVAEIAVACPAVVVLLHHLGLPSAETIDADRAALITLLERAPGVFVKVSGPHYAGPDVDPIAMINNYLSAVPPARLLWGSDAPASRRHGLDYAGALDLIRSTALDPESRELVLGGTYRRLFPR